MTDPHLTQLREDVASKVGHVSLGGIRYRIDVHEGMATFVECDRMSCTRITLQKCEPRGLVYLQASSSTGFVPFCHIKKAVTVYEHLFGPNHYLSLKAMHRSERNIAARRLWKRPIFKLAQRLFWTHEVPIRFKSVWWVIKHQFRLLRPERAPSVKWSNEAARIAQSLREQTQEGRDA